MTTLITRSEKDAMLTHSEMDANWRVGIPITKEVSGGYSIDSDDDGNLLICNAPCFIDMPVASQVGDGFFVSIKRAYRTGTATVIMTHDGAAIDESSTIALHADSGCVTLVCDGANWHHTAASAGWGDISGNIGDQPDLQAALANTLKPDVSTQVTVGYPSITTTLSGGGAHTINYKDVPIVWWDITSDIHIQKPVAGDRGVQRILVLVDDTDRTITTGAGVALVAGTSPTLVANGMYELLIRTFGDNFTAISIERIA